MPIYEFYCPDNRKIYSFFARSLAQAGATPRCPDNPKFRMERMVSKFAVTGRAKEAPAPGDAPGDDDPKMEAAMAEMEREFSTMDTDNPDPRRLAQVVRKMSALTGEKIPAETEEMIRRMEMGEDPDKLEEEYGDAPDPFGGGEEGGPGEPAETETESKARLARRKPPQRDPVLYEMNDYIG